MTYIMFGIKSFSNRLAYRSEVWLRTFGSFIAIIIQIAIWKAVIGAGTIAGINLEQMMTYSILSTLITVILLTHVSSSVSDSLRTGSIATQLIKPMSYPLFLLSEGLGGVAYELAFIVTPSFMISWIVFGLLPPASALHFAAFLIALVITLLLSFLLGYLISLLSFWFLTHFALDWTLGGFMIIFSGQFLPLWFFPEGWASLAEVLPFQYLGYIPLALYLGYIPAEDIGVTLIVGFAWILGLFAFTQWLWSRAVRRLVVQGG